MKKVRRAGIALIAALLGLAVTGCSFGGKAPIVPFINAPSQSEQALPTPLPTQQPDDENDSRSLYGSVGLLSQPTTLVSVYLDDTAGCVWDSVGLEKSRESLGVAVAWLQEQCAAYGVQPQITWADDDHPDLEISAEYEGSFVNDTDLESNEFCEELDAFCAEVDTAEFEETYGSNIGFLFFLPMSGCDITIVHYAEDGTDYPYEYCMLYEYDIYMDTPFSRDAPAAYAHEILHLFGANDLYEGSSDPCVTPEFTDFVAENWPGDIMLYTYEDDGSIRYDGISQVISPVTAYFLGLCDTFEGLENYPAAKDEEPGVFHTEFGMQENDDSTPRTLQEAAGEFI